MIYGETAGKFTAAFQGHQAGTDLRTAAFIDAIDKIAVCYQDLGIFP